MADAAIRVLREPDLAEKLRQAGLNEASKYAWPQVRMLWLEAYNRVASARGKK
jgi:glycosyltransferase involved in cell wall biosynthesis